MKPPSWFTRLLAQMDPLLSVRRSIVTNHWVIERKGVILGSEIETLRRRRDRFYKWITWPATPEQREQLHKNRKEWQSLSDEVVSAEQQKRVICRPRTINRQVYDDLCSADIQRYGGFARFCTETEQHEERLEADQERVLSNRRKAFNAEVFDMLSFLRRKRLTALDHQKDDWKYLLHGKHSQEGDGPIVVLTDF